MQNYNTLFILLSDVLLDELKNLIASYSYLYLKSFHFYLYDEYLTAKKLSKCIK